MTGLAVADANTKIILIHTSVKLVTYHQSGRGAVSYHFNPHEREARDDYIIDTQKSAIILIHTSVKLVTKLQQYYDVPDIF